MITPEQIKKIHTLKNVLKLKEEWYRDNLYSHFKVYSSKKLTSAQAENFILKLEDEAIKAGLWKRPAQKYDHLSGRVGMATPKQLRMIEAMWKEVSYYEDPKERRTALRALLENKKIGICVSDLAFLKKSDVKQVIAIIKDMKKRKEKKEQLKKGA